MKYYFRLAVTVSIVAVAVVLVGWRYSVYLTNPWTRDGQVMADIVQVAPRVSGPVIEVAVSDNQQVKAGDLLFRIDPRTYEAALAKAQAEFNKAKDNIAALTKQIEASEASVEQYRALIPSSESQLRAAESSLIEAERSRERFAVLLERGTVPQAVYDEKQNDYDVALAAKEQAEIALLNAKSALTQAEATLAQTRANRGRPPPDNAILNSAAAALETAQLNLDFTEVKATVDGFITNMDLRVGEQAVAYSPLFALIDQNTYWIDAYFRETLLTDVAPGNQAVVTLMRYPDQPLEGVVDSINWGIAQSDGSTGVGLLPNVSATFEWIRLAQRIPVKIKLSDVPNDIQLVVGTTASVLVRGEGESGELVAIPTLLQ